jgi:hypothetical protein
VLGGFNALRLVFWKTRLEGKCDKDEVAKQAAYSLFFTFASEFFFLCCYCNGILRTDISGAIQAGKLDDQW